jgi:hypothetical protein
LAVGRREIIGRGGGEGEEGEGCEEELHRGEGKMEDGGWITDRDTDGGWKMKDERKRGHKRGLEGRRTRGHGGSYQRAGGSEARLTREMQGSKGAAWGGRIMGGGYVRS